MVLISYIKDGATICGRRPRSQTQPIAHFAGRKKGERSMRARVPTGIEGLDNLIDGGLQQNKVFLISGEAGTGKTTLCMPQICFYPILLPSVYSWISSAKTV